MLLAALAQVKSGLQCEHFPSLGNALSHNLHMSKEWGHVCAVYLDKRATPASWEGLLQRARRKLVINHHLEEGSALSSIAAEWAPRWSARPTYHLYVQTVLCLQASVSPRCGVGNGISPTPEASSQLG